MSLTFPTMDSTRLMTLRTEDDGIWNMDWKYLAAMLTKEELGKKVLSYKRTRLEIVYQEHDRPVTLEMPHNVGLPLIWTIQRVQDAHRNAE